MHGHNFTDADIPSHSRAYLSFQAWNIYTLLVQARLGQKDCAPRFDQTRVWTSDLWIMNRTFHVLNSYCASHDNWCTATLWNRIMTAQCEGMGEVGSARYEPALLPPCPSIRVLSYSNCQEITHASRRAWQCKCGAVRSAASSYAAMRMVAGSRPDLVIAWEWHIGLALLCGCSGALKYPTTNSFGPINKSLSLSLSLRCSSQPLSYRGLQKFGKNTLGKVLFYTWQKWCRWFVTLIQAGLQLPICSDKWGEIVIKQLCELIQRSGRGWGM